MSINNSNVINREENGCPHAHKASLVLENGELAGEFLSRHFENCKVCNSKLEKLKGERLLFLKQIPFVSSPQEVKDIFAVEAVESTLKVKRKVTQIKRRKLSKSSQKFLSFLADFKEALLSKPVIISLCIVSTVWSYLKIFS